MIHNYKAKNSPRTERYLRRISNQAEDIEVIEQKTEDIEEKSDDAEINVDTDSLQLFSPPQKKQKTVVWEKDIPSDLKKRLFKFSGARRKDYHCCTKLVHRQDIDVSQLEKPPTNKDADNFYCERCHELIPYKSGNVNSLLDHMKEHHSELMRQFNLRQSNKSSL